MVVVKIEMWPKGQESKAYHLGTLKICLDPKTKIEDKTRSYSWFAEKKGGGIFKKKGSIDGHNPKSKNQWDLLFGILRQMVGYRNLEEK